MVRGFRKDFRENDITWVCINFASAVMFTVLFHFALKLRAAIGRLPNKDLDTFLVDTLFKGGLKTLFSILFLLFRTTKCAFEEGRWGMKKALAGVYHNLFVRFVHFRLPPSLVSHETNSRKREERMAKGAEFIDREDGEDEGYLTSTSGPRFLDACDWSLRNLPLFFDERRSDGLDGD